MLLLGCRPMSVAPSAPPRANVPFFDPSPSTALVRERVLEDVEALLDSGAFIERPAGGGVRGGVRRVLRHGALRRGRERARRAPAGAARRRARAGRRGDRPGDDVRRDVRGGHAGGRRPGRRGRDRGRLRPRPGSGRAAAIDAAHALLLPVHLYGQMADMRGSERSSRRSTTSPSSRTPARRTARRATACRAGAVGVAAAFSFYPAKNLGAIGDAGALVTDDADLAAAVRALREHGQRAKYEHAVEGYTARLDTIQAIVLLHKLPHLDEWNERAPGARAAYYAELSRASATSGFRRCPTAASPVWHLYVVRTADPAALAAHPRRARDRHAAGTTPSRRTSPRRTRSSATAPDRSRSPSAEPRGALAADLPGHHRGAARGGRRRRSARTSTGLADGPPSTTRRIGCSRDVEFGEGVVVQSFTNLYGCRIGDDTRDRPVRRDPARRR